MSDQPPPPPPQDPAPQQPPGAMPPPAPSGMPAPPPGLGVPRPAELLDRFLARLIDGVILGIVFGICNVLFASIFLRGFTYSVGEYLLYWLFVSVITVVVSLGYYAYFESSNGATVGKQLMKLKVVGPSGTGNPTMEQAIRRNIWIAAQLAFIVPIVGTFLGGIAYLAAVIMIAVGINNDTVNRQGWHDHFAGGTRVLKVG